MNSDGSTTPSAMRKMRLKQLLDESLAIEDVVERQSSKDTLDAVHNIITLSDDIISEGSIEDRIEHTSEMVMDAQLLKKSHELVSKVLEQTSKFSELAYQTALKQLTTDSGSNWDAIANIACSIAGTTRIKSTMLGATETAPKEHVVKQLQQRQGKELGEEKHPDEVVNLERQNKGAEKMSIVHQQIVQIFNEQNCESMPFYKLIIDPNNFMHSVENAFQLSFLVRENTVAIEEGSDGLPEVHLTTKQERDTDMEAKAWTCSLNEKKCQEMIAYYDIKTALLNATAGSESDDQ